MAKLSLLEKIFSITNNGIFKVITILGFSIKIDQTQKYKKICKALSINKNKIVFENFKGNSYGCNPKYITEEIIKRKLPYELVWIVKSVTQEKEMGNFPPEVRLVSRGGVEALKELSSAKLWIDNQRKIYYLRRGLEKRNSQYYIQTWHGSLGIKKIGLDSPLSNVENEWIPFGKQDAEMIDYIISNSDFETNVFKTNFFGQGNIKPWGHARNDIFFKNTEEIDSIKSKIRKFYNISENKKIMLYIPSFRDNFNLECFNIDTQMLKIALNNRFGGDWVIAIRMHPHLKKYSTELFKFSETVIDTSFYPDIQELLVSSDGAITDYSSCIFDFMLSKKPAFVFATDIKDYNTDRGFYYPLESTPFPVATNNEKLEQNILNFDNEKYQKEVALFLKDKSCIEDGHASERIVDLIEKIMKDEV